MINPLAQRMETTMCIIDLFTVVFTQKIRPSSSNSTKKKTINQVVSKSVALVLNVMMRRVPTRVPGRRFYTWRWGFYQPGSIFCAKKWHKVTCYRKIRLTAVVPWKKCALPKTKRWCSFMVFPSYRFIQANESHDLFSSVAPPCPSCPWFPIHRWCTRRVTSIRHTVLPRKANDEILAYGGFGSNRSWPMFNGPSTDQGTKRSPYEFSVKMWLGLINPYEFYS